VELDLLGVEEVDALSPMEARRDFLVCVESSAGTGDSLRLGLCVITGLRPGMFDADLNGPRVCKLTLGVVAAGLDVMVPVGWRFAVPTDATERDPEATTFRRGGGRSSAAVRPQSVATPQLVMNPWRSMIIWAPICLWHSLRVQL
jgi:hypothetical protein